MGIEKIVCDDVRREISNYLDGDLESGLRERMNQHFAECAECKSLLDGTRNVLKLVGDRRAFSVPRQLSQRLHSKLAKQIGAPLRGLPDAAQEIPLGITHDRVPLGSHLVYFWQSDEDFERGVRFLHPGLGRGEHCIIFGHDEALEKVLATLRSHSFDPDALVLSRQLTVLPRRDGASATVSAIGAAVQEALREGASAVRFLGNLGMGHAPLPAGESDVVDLECKASALIAGLPCVIVCMYDVRTLSGRMILNGGLRTHDLAICDEGVRANPYFNPESEPPAGTRLVQ